MQNIILSMASESYFSSLTCYFFPTCSVVLGFLGPIPRLCICIIALYTLGYMLLITELIENRS